jgi:hypothetical protein
MQDATLPIFVGRRSDGARLYGFACALKLQADRPAAATVRQVILILQLVPFGT